MVASHDVRHGEVFEINGTQWRHPITGATCRGQIMFDVGSRCVMVNVFEETLQILSSNISTGECRDAVIDGWTRDRPRPDLARLDPDVASVSNAMLGVDVQVTPLESLAPERARHRAAAGEAVGIAVRSGRRQNEYMCRVSEHGLHWSQSIAQALRIHAVSVLVEPRT